MWPNTWMPCLSCYGWPSVILHSIKSTFWRKIRINFSSRDLRAVMELYHAKSDSFKLLVPWNLCSNLKVLAQLLKRHRVTPCSKKVTIHMQNQFNLCIAFETRSGQRIDLTQLVKRWKSRRFVPHYRSQTKLQIFIVLWGQAYVILLFNGDETDT
jgi:hypothetical protein